MRISKAVALVAAGLLSLSLQAASPASDIWSPVRFLLGQWSGTAAGEPGEGTVTRQYDFVLSDKFIHETNKSVYTAKEKDKHNEVHEHFSYISYDKARKLIVMRQFHVEGFVNQYVLNPTLATTKKVDFESERFENFSNEWRARETYDIVSADEFVETF
jgi:hypothetical protein